MFEFTIPFFIGIVIVIGPRFYRELRAPKATRSQLEDVIHLLELSEMQLPKGSSQQWEIELLRRRMQICASRVRTEQMKMMFKYLWLEWRLLR